MKGYSIKVFDICILLLTLLINIGISKADVCRNETSTKGNEFWIAFLQNHDEELVIPHGLDLIFGSDKATSVSIINEAHDFKWDFSMEANTTKSVTVPCQIFNVIEYGEVVDKALHIVSKEPISLYMNNHQNISSDATVALPTTALGSYYIIQNNASSIESHYHSFMPSIFSLVALENNTKVQITPTLNTNDGHDANKPYTVTLHKGQVYQVASTQADLGQGLSGTQVLALNGKKIAVYTGNRSSNVPYSETQGNSNILFEASYPVSTWGKKFFIQPFITGFVDMVKCTACKNGTKIFKNGTLIKTIDAFESYEFFINESDGPFKLETSEPTSVYQYMTSSNYKYKRTNGAPSQLYVNPIEQRIKNITLCTSNHELISAHFINLVINTNDISSIKLDGKTNFTKFTPVDDTYSTGYVLVSSGRHTIESPSGFIANVYGTGNELSYAFNAGSNIYDLNTESYNEAKICEGDTLKFHGKDFFQTGFYIDTLKNNNGCDSLTFLNLTVYPLDTVYFYDTITVGESYIKNGFTYNNPKVGVYNEIKGECPNFTYLELVVENEPCPEGTLIFKEDFGGNNSTDPEISFEKIPQCSYELNSDPRDQYLKGRYSIRKRSYSYSSWTNTVDHTYPKRDDRGYFMQCDAANNEGEDPGVLYSVQIDDLCDSVPLYFSFWGMSMIKKGADSTYANANLRLVVEDTDGNILRIKDFVLPNGKETWTLYGLPYQMPAGKTSAVFKILNNSTIHYGNDFAIDDIEIRMCKPLIDVKEEENLACIGTNLALSAEINDFNKTVTYEWYYSKSTKIQSADWVLVGNEKKLEINNLKEENNGFYRVFVGGEGKNDLINSWSPASDLIEVNVKDCFPPKCNADTVVLATCSTLDTLIDVLNNDSIINKHDVKMSLIDAPANAKIVDNMLSYKLIDANIKNDTVKYVVKLGYFSDTTSVIFKIDHPSKVERLDTTICSGSEYKELMLFKDTILIDSTIIAETGCHNIINHIVTVIDIDASINDTALCEGNSTTLSVMAPEGCKYTWYNDSSHKTPIGNEKSLYVKPKETTTYNIAITSGKCSKELESTVEVLSLPYISNVNEVDKNDLEFIVEGGNGSYVYNLGQTWTSDNMIKNYIHGIEYNIKIKDTNGCISDTIIKAPTIGFDFPTIVSPNGDGINDVFEISKLDGFTDVTVEIYERHGKLLLQHQGKGGISWDGRLNGHRMHSDDYWYVIDIKDINKTIVGHFTLLWDD